MAGGMRISDLTTASAVADSDLLEVAKVDGNSSSGYMSYKETMSAIAIYITKLATYSNDLNTTDKHIIGAINELKQLVSLIPQFAIEVVAQLPTQDISETTIYLVPNSDPEQGNYYEEYIYVNNAWELVGSTEVDLSDYYTKSQVDGMFNGLATVATSGSYTDLINKPTIDSALSTSSTNAVQNQVITNKINGLMDVTETLDTTPYVYRQTPSGQYTVKEQLIGGSVVWNQLVDTNTTSVTITSGHKYISKINSVWAVAISDGTAISVDGSRQDMVIDITAEFGTTIANYIYTLEQNTSGSGVAWFRKYFPNVYYAYSAPTIQSTKVSSKVVKDSDNQTVATYDLSGSHLVKRNYALVDLGSLNYSRDTSYTEHAFFTYSTTIPKCKNTDVLTTIPNLCCPLYLSDTVNNIDHNTNDKRISVVQHQQGVRIWIADSAYTDTTALKNSLNGVYLLYELATPTTETVTNPTLYGIWKLDANNNLYFDGDEVSDIPNPQIVENGGTEQFIDAEVQAGNRDVSMPVGGGHKYGNNPLIGKLLEYIQN